MKGNCSVQHCALAAQCVKKRKLRQASSLREVDLHGLMLVTMKVLNRYNESTNAPAILVRIGYLLEIS